MSSGQELPELKGRGMFVYSDPGAAKAVLAEASRVKDKLNACTVISDREYAFSGAFGVTVNKPSPDLSQDIAEFQPDFIFTGTSYTSDLEIRFVELARKLKIPSFSFIDHWTSLKKRFSTNDRYIFPDHVLVIDERAYDLAVADGIDKSVLAVYGNPYYAYLQSWKPEASKKDLLASLNIPDDGGLLVVYAPDPLSNVNGNATFGFDEVSATAAIAGELGKTKDVHFVLKPHPNQDLGKLQAVAGKHIVFASQQTDSNTLIYYADLVVGFFSNFLIEADKMGKRVLRLHLHTIENDPVAPLNIGEVVDVKELIAAINNR